MSLSNIYQWKAEPVGGSNDIQYILEILQFSPFSQLFNVQHFQCSEGTCVLSADVKSQKWVKKVKNYTKCVGEEGKALANWLVNKVLELKMYVSFPNVYIIKKVVIGLSWFSDCF